MDAEDLEREVFRMNGQLIENTTALKALAKSSDDHEGRIRLIERKVTLWCGAIGLASVLSGLVAHYLLHL